MWKWKNNFKINTSWPGSIYLVNTNIKRNAAEFSDTMRSTTVTVEHFQFAEIATSPDIAHLCGFHGFRRIKCEIRQNLNFSHSLGKKTFLELVLIDFQFRGAFHVIAHCPREHLLSNLFSY